MTWLFTPQGFLYPELSLNTQAFIRLAYGVLLFGTLLSTLPHWHRYYLSERWGGYTQSARLADAIQNPIVFPFLMIIWLGLALLIAVGYQSVWAALLNGVLCWYFFVHMRWHGLLRGMGAPGFMTYWLAVAVFLLEFTLRYTPQVRPLALLVIQIDFAFIMLSAGTYKLAAGWPHNYGMQYGMANPQWGHWDRFYRNLPPEHILFKILNQLAWLTEIGGGLLMLIPPTRFIGALLIIGSFVFIATQIRLGLLCYVVMLCGALFFHPGSLGDLALRLAPSLTISNPAATALPPALILALASLLWVYLILLPVAHGSLFYNLFGNRRLPGLLQRALELYTNFLGIIIWRVFSIDHTNFAIMIYAQPGEGGERLLLSKYGFGGLARFTHVAESITITTLFTALKYFPSNSALFTQRLLRYAKTLPTSPGWPLIFEYVSISSGVHAFDFAPVAEYIIDPVAGTVEEHILSDKVSVRAAHPGSPVREGVRPGSYIRKEGAQ